MNYQTSPADLTVAERFVPDRVRRHMGLLATAISGPIETAQHRHAQQLGNCLVVAGAELLIHGTTCAYPLNNLEVEEMASATGYDAVLLRATPDLFSGRWNILFDIISHDYPHWMLGYRAWDGGHHGEWWFVPNENCGPCVRASKRGLDISERLPFADADLFNGLERATRFFASSVREY